MRFTTCGTEAAKSGYAAGSMRTGIGGGRTLCRTGPWGMTWSTRLTAVCNMRGAPCDGQSLCLLQLKADQLVVAALAAARPQDASIQESLDFVLVGPKQLGAGAGLGVGDEAGLMLLHRAVSRGLLGGQ